MKEADQAEREVGSEKECPYCAETIKAAAIKCRFCGEMLGKEKEAPPLPRASEAPIAPCQPWEPSFGYFFPGLMVAAGIGLFFYGSTMDVTVATGNDLIERVANIHLMNRQKNFQMSGAFITFLGLAFAFYVSKTGSNPSTAIHLEPREVVPEEVIRSDAEAGRMYQEAEQRYQEQLAAIRGEDWWDNLPESERKAVVVGIVFLLAMALIFIVGMAH